MGNLNIHAQKVVEHCKKLATFSEVPNGTRRTFLSPPMHDCHREIAHCLAASGAEVSVDAAGNLRGFYPAADCNAPRLMLGSHLDTVPNAGAYDGTLGVVMGTALLESLQGQRLPFAIEVVGFSEEEGVRFGVPFIGSRALVGRLDEDLLNHRDKSGMSVKEAIRDFGLDPTKIPLASLTNDTVAYLEFHIEQGPLLESMALPLAAVDAIVAQIRMEFVFTGHANHAGTTPMNLRHDALAGAAEWIAAVESAALATPGLVATVGQIEAKPGSVNVIPGTVRVTLDVRHKADGTCTQATNSLIHAAKEIATRRGLALQHRELLRQKSVKMDEFLLNQVEEAIRRIGCEPHRMASGAGHDAMILAEKVPTAMILLQSPGGISHDPAESVRVQDVAKALECGLQLFDQLAKSPEFLKRTCRA